MADYANVIFSLSEPDQPRLLKSPIEGNLVTGVGIDIQASASETSDATILRIKAKGSNWGATAKALEIDASEGYAIPITVEGRGGTLLRVTHSGTSYVRGADAYDYLEIAAYPSTLYSPFMRLCGRLYSTSPGAFILRIPDTGHVADAYLSIGTGTETLANTKIYMGADGRVGIYTTDPDRNFHVATVAKFDNLVAIRVDKDDYGGNFTNYTPPSGAVEGDMLFAVDTNATNPGQRLYAYLNGAWHYVDLT